jgi:16S rRNA (adenine1518-N6/adenine1519-N6)-dimethyltransferase
MSLHALPPLREALSEHGLFADKRFGQHFLLDLNLTRKIARLAAPLDACVVIEVGPGPGGLTRALIEEGAEHVIAIEKDRRFIGLLHAVQAAAGGRLTVLEADALKINEAAFMAAHAPALPAKIVANLPYNVGTALLIRWLTGAFTPALMVLMFQKEVADRIAAKAGEEAYGRLSVLAQTLTATRVAMTLPARAFTPPPKVDSAVVVLIPRSDRPPPHIVQALERVTAAAFGQRRKMLRSSLKALGGEALCVQAGVDPNARAETVDVAGFLRLAAAIASA